jgi:hypothetical protein
MQSNLKCIKHPSYSGDSSPDLSCKICCSLFVAKIRNDHAQMAKKSFEKISQDPRKGDLNSYNKPSYKSFDGSWI